MSDQGGIKLEVSVLIRLTILYDLCVLNTEVTCFCQPSMLLPLVFDSSIKTRGCESLEHISKGLIRLLLSCSRNKAFNYLIGGGFMFNHKGVVLILLYPSSTINWEDTLAYC